MQETCFSSLTEARKKMGFKNIRDMINKAHSIAKEFRQKETELIEILGQLDQTKAYRATGYNSLSQFCIESLLLTDHQAYQYITVSRKCVEIPELMVALEDGRITVSKARKMSSVINSENKQEWISLAEKSSQKELERAVRGKDPLPPVRDLLQILSSTEVKLQATIDQEVNEKLRRVMEILSERSQGGIKINHVLGELCEEYLKKHDPLRKAERILKKVKKTKRSAITKDLVDAKKNSVISKNHSAKTEFSQNREPIPAKTKHQVWLRDQGQCRFHRNGKRCDRRQYLQIHHKIPVSNRGGNTLENLVLLCSEHHKIVHRNF